MWAGLERQWTASGNPVNVVRIHPRVYWEEPSYFQKKSEVLSALETAPVLYRSQLFELRGGHTQAETVYTIGVLECSHDIIVDIRAITVKAVVNEYREGQPEIEMFPEGCSHVACATQLEVETAWRCEYDLLPSSTYMHQFDAFPWLVIVFVDYTGVKYISSQTSSGSMTIVAHLYFFPMPRKSTLVAVACA
jgi:hypothetical protein